MCAEFFKKNILICICVVKTLTGPSPLPGLASVGHKSTPSSFVVLPVSLQTQTGVNRNWVTSSCVFYTEEAGALRTASCVVVFTLKVYYLRISVFYLGACLCTSVQWPEEGVGLLGTAAADSCESLCGCWELDPGPLEEHPMPPIAISPALIFGFLIGTAVIHTWSTE